MRDSLCPSIQTEMLVLLKARLTLKISNSIFNNERA